MPVEDRGGVRGALPAGGGTRLRLVCPVGPPLGDDPRVDLGRRVGDVQDEVAQPAQPRQRFRPCAQRRAEAQRKRALREAKEQGSLIADAISTGVGESIDKRTIALGNPIKSLGAHQVTVRVHPEVTAQVRLNVVASK